MSPMREHSEHKLTAKWVCVACWLVLLAATLASTALSAEYFIGSGPIVPNYMGPLGIAMYRLDPESGGVQEVWRAPKGDYFTGVKVYYPSRVAVVFAEPWGYKPSDKLYVISFDSTSQGHEPLLDYRGTGSSVADCRVVENSDGHSFLKVSVVNRSSASSSAGDTVMIDLNTRKTAALSSLSASATTRLSGAGSSLRSRAADIKSADLKRVGDQWVAVDTTVLSMTTPIPDSIVQMKTSFGWNLVADQSGYSILNSIPDRSGLKTNELLVFDKSDSTWTSMTIPGTVTKLRLFNGLLGGVIKDDDPARNYQKRIGGPPVPREEVVLVDPARKSSFTVHLGERCELLSIEGDTVYYKVDLELYRARIEGNDFVDRQLIWKDLQVAGITAAFSSEE